MPRRLVKPWHVGRLYGETVSKDSVCHLETRPSPMARRAIPQRTKSQHAVPNLTTNSGSPNRSNTGDPLMPYQSLALRGHVASGNAMEIYGLPRGADATIPTHVRNLLGWTPLLLRRSALYPIASLSYRLRLPDIDVQAGSRTLGPRRVYLVLSQFHECLRWLQRCVSWETSPGAYPPK